jgi:hypothetical protein
MKTRLFAGVALGLVATSLLPAAPATADASYVTVDLGGSYGQIMCMTTGEMTPDLPVGTTFERWRECGHATDTHHTPAAPGDAHREWAEISTHTCTVVVPAQKSTCGSLTTTTYDVPRGSMKRTSTVLPFVTLDMQPDVLSFNARVAGCAVSLAGSLHWDWPPTPPTTTNESERYEVTRDGTGTICGQAAPTGGGVGGAQDTYLDRGAFVIVPDPLEDCSDPRYC